MYDRLK